MAVDNKSHHNHALMSLNRIKRETNTPSEEASNFECLERPKICLEIKDCCDFLKSVPSGSVQLICIDPPYNLELEKWDVYEDYTTWAASWLQEAYRVLCNTGNLVIFGGIQFRDAKSGDLLDLLHYIRHYTKFKLINTVIWHYKNGMSSMRFFANRHEEAVWLAKSDDYYFDLDSVREPYSPEGLEAALKDKRLNPENVKKGKNPTNVWEINRLNGSSRERVGHPTQKPAELIRRFVKSLSYPRSTVLDFFAGSGTTGRVCIEEGRNCLMCDSDYASEGYFEKQLELMNKGAHKLEYIRTGSIKDFFDKEKA